MSKSPKVSANVYANPCSGGLKRGFWYSKTIIADLRFPGLIGRRQQLKFLAKSVFDPLMPATSVVKFVQTVFNCLEDTGCAYEHRSCAFKVDKVNDLHCQGSTCLQVQTLNSLLDAEMAALDKAVHARN
jgi:hypothetical protein